MRRIQYGFAYSRWLDLFLFPFGTHCLPPFGGFYVLEPEQVASILDLALYDLILFDNAQCAQSLVHYRLLPLDSWPSFILPMRVHAGGRAVCGGLGH